MTRAVAATVTPTWSAPLASTRPRMRRSPSNENSIPTPKRRSATPSSASSAIPSVRDTSPSPPRPTSTPAIRYATIDGSRSARPTISAAVATARSTITSRNTAASIYEQVGRVACRSLRRSVQWRAMVIRPGVSAIILTPEGVLLQRRSDNGLWGLPGGSVEPGESVSEALVREVMEETGLEVAPVRLVGVYSAPALGQVVTYPDGNVIHYVSSSFECRIVGGSLACGSESMELEWFPPDALPDELMPMHRIRIADALVERTEPFVR